jgi:hypothetical protein
LCPSKKNETRHSLDFGVVIIDKEKKRWKCFSLAFQKEKNKKTKKKMLECKTPHAVKQ